MNWPWSRKPVGLRLHARQINELAVRVARIEAIPERMIYLDAHETTPRLPDDWPQTVGQVAQLVRRVEALQAEIADLRKALYARKNR